MTEVEQLPSWVRRRLNRHFERGGSGRILRWMSLPAGRGHGTAIPAGAELCEPGAVLPFVQPPAIQARTPSPFLLAAG